MAPMYSPGEDLSRLLLQDEAAVLEVHVDAVGPEQRIAKQAGGVSAADHVQLSHREFVRGQALEDQGAERDRQAVEPVESLCPARPADGAPDDPRGVDLRLDVLLEERSV